jgi:predicted kinase
VEFEPAFRCGDLANDLSFLVMDLEFRKQDQLARALVTRYTQRFNDNTLDVVLPFYKCHRSLVRGKVRALAWQQHPRSTAGRHACRLSRRHFQLAVQYARAFSPPRLIVVGGLIGTGKSTLARALADAFGAVWLRTDEIRIRDLAADQPASTRYTSRMSARVYARLMQRACSLLRQGHSVVCDGTFSKAEGREALRTIAQQAEASFHFVECVASRAVACRRMAQRRVARTDLSEAGPEHYDTLQAGYEPIRHWPSQAWTRLSTHRTPQQTFRAALEALRHAWTR